MKPLKLKAQLAKANRRADGSVSISFVTQEEIATDLFTHIDEYWQQNGWVMFKPNEFKDSEIPKEEAKVEGALSPSQYLRRCLYAKHMATGGTHDTFPVYYNKAMAGFAQAVNDSFPEG
jgi:hypothetical protein